MPIPAASGGEASLLLIRAGATGPMHTHRGIERTLVLSGSFSDDYGTFAAGDCAVADGEVEHRPTAGTEADCLCLAVSDAPPRFTGAIGPFLNLWNGR